MLAAWLLDQYAVGMILDKPKSPIEAHFVLDPFTDVVLDARFVDGSVRASDEIKELVPFEFTAEEPRLPLYENVEDFPRFPLHVTSGDYVNGITVLREARNSTYAISSGLELLEIIVPGKGEKAAISTSQANGFQGMPAQFETAWVAEFPNTETALEFWDAHWRPYYTVDQVQEDLKYFKRDKIDELHPSQMTAYPTGILRPWFHQTDRDALFGDHFASDGAYALDARTRGRLSDEYRPGGVYYFQERNEDRQGKVHVTTRVATCLGAVSVQIPQKAWGGDSLTKTYIQWHDGTMGVHKEGGDTPAPEPLTRSDLLPARALRKAA